MRTKDIIGRSFKRTTRPPDEAAGVPLGTIVNVVSADRRAVDCDYGSASHARVRRSVFRRDFVAV